MEKERLFKFMKYRKGFFNNLLIATPRNFQLNDPFESNPSEGISLQIINQLREKEGLLPYQNANEIKLVASPYRSQPKSNVYSNFGSVSFSNTHTKSLMWSYYADEHRGIVLEFDPNHPFFKEKYSSSNPSTGKLIPVAYTPERPDLLDNPLDLIFTKGKEWEHEEEVRMIIPKKMCSHFKETPNGELMRCSDDTFREKKSTEENFLYFIKIPPESITSIYLGTRMNSSHIREIHRKILLTPALSHIQVFDTRINPNKFALDFIPSVELW